MKLGVNVRTARRARTPPRWRVLLLLGGLALSAPARGADPPTLKETLGKVQSDAEAKAVNDLIDKLKGVSRKPAAPTPAPAPAAAPVTPAPAAASVPAPAAPAPSAPLPQPAPPAVTTPPAEPPGPVASPATPEAPAPAPAIKPDEAVKRAAQSQAPSIDLEIYFDYNSAEITPRAAAALTPLGRALSDARLAGDAFLIAGHSDGKGGADYNLALSQKRAESVRRHLIANFGIDGTKLVATGMGSKHLKNAKQPLSPENRRVQIVNLSKDEAAKPGHR
jgi:outer membrane protein OmpA-like peptidoglycan-associated protein